MDYYDRTETFNTDGTPLFACDTDNVNETIVTNEIESVWNCKIKRLGKLCPVDFYAIRDGRVVGVIELKTRSHNHDKYPTVFLNFRKWITLKMAAFGSACPAIFVVKFKDGIYYTPLDNLPNMYLSIGGAKKIVKSHTDIEPVFNVPINFLKPLKRQ